MERLYKKLPDMECLAGDTLPVFTVNVETGINLAGCTMQILLEDQKAVGLAALAKKCTPIDNGFQVQLTSNDTSNLHGIYNMHFCLTDANSLNYRKLAGILYVKRTAQGV